ncbi:hypothetical protein NMG60_11022836 [Bertholletia excelsa]
MKKNRRSLVLFVLLLVALILAGDVFRLVEGGQRRISITDDLDDVVDDEEDEAWKEWGKKKSSPEFDPPPMDFSGMDIAQIQTEMLKRQIGPVMGFIKLRLGVQRTKEMVSEIAMKWTQLARTGAIELRFTGIDLTTIMFTMERGQDSLELKDFILSQPDAYEIKLGDQVYRRPGDPPLEQVIEKLKNERNKENNSSPKEVEEQRKDEL